MRRRRKIVHFVFKGERAACQKHRPIHRTKSLYDITCLSCLTVERNRYVRNAARPEHISPNRFRTDGAITPKKESRT